MDSIITPGETARINELWSRVGPRLEPSGLPGDFFPLAATDSGASGGNILSIPELPLLPEPATPASNSYLAVSATDSEPAAATTMPEQEHGGCFESCDPSFSAQLARLIMQEKKLESKYARLAANTPARQAARQFSALKVRQRAIIKRLSAAYYLMSGEPPPAAVDEVNAYNGNWLAASRELFHEETRASVAYRHLSSGCSDECLETLLKQASQAKSDAADGLLRLLEDAL